MLNVEVGDIVIYSNGQKFRVVKGKHSYLMVGLYDFEVYFEVVSIDSLMDLNLHEDIYVLDIIKSSMVQTIQVI